MLPETFNFRLFESKLIPGSGELTVVCSAFWGSCLFYGLMLIQLKFLWGIRLLAIGGLVGIIALMIHQPLTLIIGAIFVMEAGS